MALQSIRGIGAAPGIGRGRAFIYRQPSPDAGEEPGVALAPTARAAEIDRFRGALEEAARQLADVGSAVAARAGSAEAAVFEAQALFLEDPTLIEAVETAIRDDGLTALAAVRD